VALLALDAAMELARLPAEVRTILEPVPDPVALGLPSENRRISRD
jgi:hypothetical protein